MTTPPTPPPPPTQKTEPTSPTTMQPATPRPAADPADPVTNADRRAAALPEARLSSLALRSGFGGLLMGLANLVPGISGGTMLLAAGVYPRFIAAIGEVTTLKFRRASMVVLGCVVLFALLAVVLLAEPVKDLVVHHRWIMYSLFIGLTLGGVPVVWRLLSAGGRSGIGAGAWVGCVVGFVLMAALGVYQGAGASGEASNSSFVFMLLAGIAGAAAMILPGVSGGYLLLVMGVYIPILSGVDAFKDGLLSRDMAVLVSVGLGVVLPVGLGVVIGVAGISNLLRWLLNRYERATLGVLLGLLIGAVVGLWPFAATVEPVEGEVIKGREVIYALPQVEGGLPPAEDATWVYADTLEPIDAEDQRTEYFRPGPLEVVGAVAFMVLGLALTLLVDRLGREKPAKPAPAAAA